MWFILKLCVGDFLLLLDVREFDIEACLMFNWFWDENLTLKVLQCSKSTYSYPLFKTFLKCVDIVFLWEFLGY